MKAKRNIDDLFRTGISGYKLQPAEEVGQRIASELFGKKATAFYSWRYLAAAVLLLALLGAGLWLFTTGNPQKDFSGDKQAGLPAEAAPTEIQNTNGETQESLSSNLGLPVPAKHDLGQEKGAQDTGESTRNMVRGELPEEIAPVSYSSKNITSNDRVSDEYFTKETGAIVGDVVVRRTPFGVMPRDISSARLAGIPETVLIDPRQVMGMEKYLEKQKNFHMFTGALFNAGMVYYPSTTDQVTWSAGLTYGLVAGRFFIETGLSYQDMKERGIYAIDLKSYDSVGYYNSVESFEIDPENHDEIIYNTKKVIVYDSLDHYTHITPYFKYSYVNIPLSVGYKIYQKEKYSVSVKTGVVLSLLVEKNIPEAAYIDPDYTIVRIHNQTPERVNWNLKWQIGLRLSYNLYKSLSVSAEPVFTKYLNSVYNTQKGYANVKPYSMGLNVGIYYGF